MNIVLAVLILGGIILFHELGHFIFAKLSGIEVTEFSLGMGPRLLSFVKGETRYSLKLLPFGGSCAMLGEDEDAEGDRAFNNKPVFNRIAVVFGGPLFNFISAFPCYPLLIVRLWPVAFRAGGHGCRRRVPG